MGIRKWRKVAKEVQNNWTRGTLGSAEEGHCALGAIGYVDNSMRDPRDNGYRYLRENSEASRMVAELALELTYTVTDKTFATITTHPKTRVRQAAELVLSRRGLDTWEHHELLQTVVLRCNDHTNGQGRIKKAVDSVIAKREAVLAKRKEAKLRREAEKAALLKRKNPKVEYQPAIGEQIKEKILQK